MGDEERELSLIGLLVGLATVAHDPTVRAITAKSAALLLASLAVVALRLPAWLRSHEPGAPATGWLLLTGWLATSLAWADHPDPGALAPWLGGAALVIATGGTLADNRLHASSAATVMLLGTALLRALGAAHGGHGNANWLGLAVAVSLPLALDGAVRPGARGRAGFALAAVAGLALLWMAQSRSALLGLIVAIAAFAPGWWRLGAAAPAAAAWWLGDTLDPLSGRLAIWGDALDATSWPFGVGLGGFHHAFLEAQGHRLAELTADEAATGFVNASTAHHDALHLLVEGGPIAPLLALGAVGGAAIALRSRWRAGAASAAVALVAGLGDTALALPAVTAPLALVVAASPPALETRPWRDRAARLAGALAVVAALPIAALGWLSQRRLTELEDTGSVAALSRLSERAPQDGEIALTLGLRLLDRGRPAEALVALERSREHLANLGTELAIGRAHLDLGDPEAATLAFERAAAIHPGSFRAQLGLAEAHRAAGRLDRAAEALAIARDVRPGDPRLRELTEALRRDRIDAETGGD